MTGMLTEVPDGPGLRSRLIVGVVGVSVVTAVVTAATVVLGCLIVFATRPVGSRDLGRRLANEVELYGMSDTDMIWLVGGVSVALLLISGSQFTLFAMWFDMEANKDLR